MPVTIKITANHKGYFEFRLCPHNNPNVPVTHDCLNQHLLTVGNPESSFSTKYYPGTENKDYAMMVLLPAGMTCAQCVIQWKYHTGKWLIINMTMCHVFDNEGWYELYGTFCRHVYCFFELCCHERTCQFNKILILMGPILVLCLNDRYHAYLIEFPRTAVLDCPLFVIFHIICAAKICHMRYG